VPAAWYWAGAATISVTAPMPVRSICLNDTEDPARFAIASGTGICSTVCLDTPSDKSPEATTTVGERNTIDFSFVIDGIPFATRSLYSARSSTTPVGESPEPAGGV
jgi:hypothetical protein